MDKASLRTEMKAFLKGLSQEELKHRSLSLEKNLLKHLSTHPQQSLSVVGMYLPLAGEPLWSAEHWENKLWKLAFPSERGESMTFILPTTLPSKGHWVQEGSEVWPDVLVIPGLAFTTEGFRLGRGGGYYDRFLENNKPRLGLIGVCFEEQLRSTWKVDSHDQKMDLVVTESRVIQC